MQPLARFVTQRPWWVLAIWALLALICAVPASLAPARLTADPGALSSSESGQVIDLLSQRFGERDSNTVLLVTQTERPLSSPAVAQQYTAFVAGLQKVPGVTRVLPYNVQNAVQVSGEGSKLALTLAQIPLFKEATPALERIRTYVQSQKKAGFDTRVTGGQAIAADFTKFAEGDTKRSEMTALPLIALVLLFVFGALVAAALPLVVGGLSITTALAGLYLLTFLIPTSTFAQSIITLVSLGAGIDYALLMVNRFREELKSGAVGSAAASPEAASAEAAYRTVMTAGRSVLLSGAAVTLAMAALLLPPIAFVRSLGIGGVLAVLFTVLASLTVLPALLTLLGERVNWPHLAFKGFRALDFGQSARESALWTALARRVTARPVLAVALSTLVLVVLALPARQMQTGYAGAWGLVEGVESRDALAAVRDLGAGGLLSQFEVILKVRGGQKYGPQSRDAFRRTVRQVEALPDVKGVISPFVSAAALSSASGGGGSLNDLAALTRRSFSTDRTLLRFTVVPNGYLRADQIDAFEARLRGVLSAAPFDYQLGGAPVGEREFSKAITSSIPLAIGAVFFGTFLLLMVAFRSLFIPLKSIVMNSLTVLAAYGVVTWVVQQGHFASLLGLPQDVGVLDSSLPLLLFAVLFGLSMDYEIFLLSRVQEEYLRLAGQPQANNESIVLAIGRTARIITSAAVIMFIVFVAFIFGRVVANKSIGLGLAVAVLLDATIVRLVLVPGLLQLAGKWNWWLPAWLEKRLPKVHWEH
ncbi:MMPL family transporter [Deinococcus detaillensis]|uniref:MMPL family transporter n=1 Tax=Deinococcus detaillensis TaxID=2592048 RepID=A0A553V5J9_9DEIO|nr:MMPL family transporter [Deinococcus detaillensis]TSA87735.1 MMPL family transporter [Deinococcus detaillensis]